MHRIFLWFLRVIVGFPIIYIKVPFDVCQDALAKLKLIPEEWTNYDTKWLKIFNLFLNVQSNYIMIRVVYRLLLHRNIIFKMLRDVQVVNAPSFVMGCSSN